MPISRVRAIEMDGPSVLRGEQHIPEQQGLSLDGVLDKALVDNPLLGDRQALRLHNGSTISFAELNRRANALAIQLSRVVESSLSFQEPSRDKIIAVSLLPDVDLIVSLLAIFKIGAAYLPLDSTFPADRVAHILDDAQPLLFLTAGSVLRASGFVNVPAEHNVPIYDLEDDITIGEKGADQVYGSSQKRKNSSNGSTLAAVLYTSGSTGTPKGVRLQHGTILHRLNWQWRTFPFEMNEVCCFKTALTFVDSIAEIWAPLLIGQPVEIVAKDVTQDTQRFIDLLDRCEITRLVLVPSLLRAMLSLLKSEYAGGGTKRRLQHLKIWVCSGEVLTGELLLEFYKCFPADTIICNYYGSTEVMGDVTYVAFKSREDVLAALIDDKIPIGTPLDNCAVYLLDSSKNLVDLGEIGELYVAGSHICSGYVRGREMERFVKNHIDDAQGYEVMFRTGDYGRIVNGQLYYEGRADSQVKIRGHRVDISEINAIINRLDDLVSTCVVLSYKAGEPEQVIIAFVIPKHIGITVSLIEDKMKEKLLPYMLPKVVQIDELPLLVNGKVDRQKLLRLYLDQCQQQSDRIKDVVMRNEDDLSREEFTLLKTVLSVVGTSSVDRAIRLTDNFFEIGGHSLNAVNVVTKLKDEGFNLDLTAFLAAKNLEEVVSFLKTNQPIEKVEHLNGYEVEMLSSSVREDVIRMISVSFSKKAELELLTGVIQEDYEVFMNELWDPLVAANLSFVVKKPDGEVVAVALNFDVFDEPVIVPHVQRLAYVFDFLESVEAPVREKHFERRTNFMVHSFMMATSETSSPSENVLLIQKMEQETLSLAKQRGFVGVFTTNTNELTRQICDDLLDYQKLSVCQVNRYIASDGTRPFIHAPDNQYSTVTVKYIH